jgi:hypothetical protein
MADIVVKKKGGGGDAIRSYPLEDPDMVGLH